MGPHPAVAAVRQAVRRALAAVAPGELVLAACSGGRDSLALAAALAFEAPRLGLRGGGVTVDHGLQPGSAAQADRVAAILASLGLDPVTAIRVTVAAPGSARYPGPEAAARAARYAALDQLAESSAAAAILLGHTLDDQAETVLLGLARGSGARSLAGMAARSGRYARPLLELRRAQTGAACAALGLRPWDDPHNEDLAYARVRVRTRLLPVLAETLGPGTVEALARTARLLRADADLLDQLADAETERIREAGPALPAGAVAELPDALRRRVLRQAALAAGCPPGALTEHHVSEMEALACDWHGQRWTDLPGQVRCQRRYGRLLFTAAVRSEGQGARD